MATLHKLMPGDEVYLNEYYSKGELIFTIRRSHDKYVMYAKHKGDTGYKILHQYKSIKRYNELFGKWWNVNFVDVLT